MSRFATVPIRGSFINGHYTSTMTRASALCSHTSSSFPLVDPNTEEILAYAPAATLSQVDEAVSAAKSSFLSGVWSGRSGVERAKVLRAIARGISSRRELFSTMESMSGKLPSDAHSDVNDAVDCLAFYAEEAEHMDAWKERPMHAPSAGKDFEWSLRYEPTGVAGLITPWNFPLLMSVWKIAPALAAGCSVVIKPSEFAPTSTLELGDVCNVAGLPPGVFNVISGLGKDVGSALCNNRSVDVLSFTGSVSTGESIMKTAANGVRPITLELGGKSAAIVFASEDEEWLERCMEWVMAGAFMNAGQVCSATSRLLVHSSIYDRFVSSLIRRTAELRVGPADDDDTQIGPVANAQQCSSIMKAIDGARASGIHVACGGTRVKSPGYFISPSILTKVPSSSDVWNKEIFGPVLCVQSFDHEEEAVKAANASEYGLAAAVFSQDDAQLHRVGNALEAGIVWYNCSQPCATEVPWGGVKRSGLGRGLGREGMMNFLEEKAVCRRTGDGWARAMFFHPRGALPT